MKFDVKVDFSITKIQSDNPEYAKQCYIHVFQSAIKEMIEENYDNIKDYISIKQEVGRQTGTLNLRIELLDEVKK